MNYKIDIIILFILTMVFLMFYEKKEVNKNQVNYLEKNTLPVISLEFSDLEANQAFVVSELHGFKINNQIKYDMLIYLHKTKGINIYLAEISYSSGYILNEYVRTGNQNLLDIIFSFYQGTNFYTKEDYAFYEKLYQYNKNLSEETKIRIYGIDIEHSYPSVFYFYEYYTTNETDNINNILDLKSIDFNIALLQKNIKASQNFYNNSDFQQRDEAMYENYRIIQAEFKFNSFFSQLGAKHGFRELSSDHFKSFTYFLHHDSLSPVKGKVISIMTFYKNSSYIEPFLVENKLYYKKENLKRSYQKNDLDYLNGNFAMIPLNKEQSPYKDRLIWYHLNENKENRVTSDYYQYLILVNKSQEATPLDSSLIITKSKTLVKFFQSLF